MEIAAHVVYELDASGKQLRVVKFTDYAADRIRDIWASAAELRARWSNVEERAAILQRWRSTGSRWSSLRRTPGSPTPTRSTSSAMLLSTRPLRTRRERAERLRARAEWTSGVLPARGPADSERDPRQVHRTRRRPSSRFPDILKVPPISDHGNVLEIAGKFGGPEQLRAAVEKLQTCSTLRTA